MTFLNLTYLINNIISHWGFLIACFHRLGTRQTWMTLISSMLTLLVYKCQWTQFTTINYAPIGDIMVHWTACFHYRNIIAQLFPLCPNAFMRVTCLFLSNTLPSFSHNLLNTSKCLERSCWLYHIAITIFFFSHLF